MKIFSSLEQMLAGWPDYALTVLLLAYGIFNILAAFLFPRVIKLVLAVYAIL